MQKQQIAHYYYYYYHSSNTEVPSNFKERLSYNKNHDGGGGDRRLNNMKYC